jgi:hypothetical protein
MSGAPARAMYEGGYQHQFGIFEFACDQARVRRGAAADRKIEVFVREIDVAIAQANVDLHARVPVAKARQ